MTSDERSLVVIGGGPAGLAAALAAAGAGLSVTLIDESGTLGGQYFRGRQTSEKEGSPRHFARRSTGISTLLDTAVVDVPGPGVLTVHDERTGVRPLRYDRLVIATGACDRAVALPGWTLPGVLTAGGASTLAKRHGVAPGRRMLVAGSGPFLLAAADDLSALGCRVEIVEATPLAASVRGLATIAADPPIATQTIGLLARLAWRRVRWRHGQLITQIHGRDRVEAATIQRVDEHWNPMPGSEHRIEADGVCLGFGFVPQLDLAQAVGCALDYDAIAAMHVAAVDAGMRTSQAGVYAAGEATGIGGMRVAIAEGRLAGLTAACDAGAITADDYRAQAATVTAALQSVRRVADWLRQAYAPRRGLWTLANADTLLCRCEEVTRADAEAALENNPPTPYAVKTATRAGMGLCQGRICGPYLAEWLRAEHGYEMPPGGRPWRIRPPLRPVPLGPWLASEPGS